MLFPDCTKAADRVTHAISHGEKIAIFGDYDCDGITATALMTRFFERRGVAPMLRLPHRLHEGYGLKSAVIEELKTAGTRLLITVDTGVTAVNEIDAAQAAGIDVIVLDHHHLPPMLPDAFAILHPAVAGLPEPHPAAAGVVWSFVNFLENQSDTQRLLGSQKGCCWKDWETDVALAAIGTVADLVPLAGSNRGLVQAGLRALQGITSGPLALLKLQAGLEGRLTSRDIAFRIAPRLNAAGRMADPALALRAVLGDEASVIALEALNVDRQDLVKELMKTALRDSEHDPSPFICLRHADYVPGVCGLIAGKLTDKLGKPSLVAHDQGEMCVGSLRSIPPYNVMEGLQSVQALLMSFGGHAMAAGCSMKGVHFDDVQRLLAAHVAHTVSPEDLCPSLEADLSIESRHLCPELCEHLRALEPHGQGNPEPSFLIRNAVLRGTRGVGKDGAHLQGFLGAAKIIGFNLGQFAAITGSTPVDLICRLGIDTWQGATNVQLFIDDLKVSVPDRQTVSR